VEIDGTLLNILGISAGILILSGWVEQIVKGYKTKSLKDVSKYLMVFIAGGSILWLVYGIIVSDVFIIGTNIAAIFLMMTVFFMKRRYDKRQKI
jgi:MtN3 and saliva related transmembrane protein